MKKNKLDKTMEELARSVASIIADLNGVEVESKKHKWVYRISDKISYEKADRKSYPRIWKIWRNMHQRCYGARSKGQEYYEHVSVCQAWFDFKWFLIWALSPGREYHPKLTLDRIDPHGNYRPANCRWSNRKQQSRNTRRKVTVDYHGKNWLLIELCEHFDMPYNSVYNRIFRYDWDIERAITQPIDLERSERHKKKRK